MSAESDDRWPEDVCLAYVENCAAVCEGLGVEFYEGLTNGLGFIHRGPPARSAIRRGLALAKEHGW